MWVLKGHHEFHPSELSKIKTIRIEKPMIKPPISHREKYSGTSVLRMRYRGPVESYKMNKAKSDIYRDLFVLRSKINNEGQRLIQYISETSNGSLENITIKTINGNGDPETLYNGPESGTTESINHRITALVREV